jgi:hypothetical protein
MAKVVPLVMSGQKDHLAIQESVLVFAKQLVFQAVLRRVVKNPRFTRSPRLIARKKTKRRQR